MFQITLSPVRRSPVLLLSCSVLFATTVRAQDVRPTLSPRVDSSAVALLNKAQRMLFDAQSLRGQVRTTYLHNGQVSGSPNTITVLAKKPNFLRIDSGGDLKPTAGADTQAVAQSVPTPAPVATAQPAPASSSGSNTAANPSGVIRRGTTVTITGDALLSLMGSMKAKAPPTRRLFTPGQAVSYQVGTDTANVLDADAFKREAADEGLQGFFSQRSSRVGQWSAERLSDLLLRSVTMVGPETWDGVSCTIVDWIYEHTYTLPSDTIVYTTRFCIGANGQIRRARTTGSNGYETDRVYDLQLDVPIDDREFSLPAIADGKSPIIKQRAEKPERPSLVGTSLPSLTPGATLLDQGPLVADALLKDANAVVLWLWAYNCSSCREEFPVAELLLRTWGARGVKFAAIDYAPGDEEYARGVRTFNRAQMPIIFGAPSWYNTMQANNSTVVVLDGKGIIRYQGYFNREAIENALAFVNQTAQR